MTENEAESQSYAVCREERKGRYRIFRQTTGRQFMNGWKKNNFYWRVDMGGILWISAEQVKMEFAGIF